MWVTVTVVQTSPWFFFLFVESSLNSRHVDLNCKYERGCQYLWRYRFSRKYLNIFQYCLTFTQHLPVSCPIDMFISFSPQVATPISDVTVPGLELATSSSAFSASSKVEVHFSAILTDSVTIKQTEPNLQKHAHLCCYCYARPPDHLILDCRKSHHLYLVACKVIGRSVALCLQVSLFCLLVSSVLWLISLSLIPTRLLEWDHNFYL
jgi:hypothetical protein